jgi:hypothetical protein
VSPPLQIRKAKQTTMKAICMYFSRGKGETTKLGTHMGKGKGPSKEVKG